MSEITHEHINDQLDSLRDQLQSSRTILTWCIGLMLTVECGMLAAVYRQQQQLNAAETTLATAITKHTSTLHRLVLLESATEVRRTENAVSFEKLTVRLFDLHKLIQAEDQESRDMIRARIDRHEDKKH